MKQRREKKRKGTQEIAKRKAEREKKYIIVIDMRQQSIIIKQTHNKTSELSQIDYRRYYIGDDSVVAEVVANKRERDETQIISQARATIN